MLITDTQTHLFRCQIDLNGIILKDVGTHDPTQEHVLLLAYVPDRFGLMR